MKLLNHCSSCFPILKSVTYFAWEGNSIPEINKSERGVFITSSNRERYVLIPIIGAKDAVFYLVLWSWLVGAAKSKRFILWELKANKKNHFKNLSRVQISKRWFASKKGKKIEKRKMSTAQRKISYQDEEEGDERDSDLMRWVWNGKGGNVILIWDDSDFSDE